MKNSSFLRLALSPGFWSLEVAILNFWASFHSFLLPYISIISTAISGSIYFRYYLLIFNHEVFFFLPTKIKNSVINSGVAEAQKKKKNKERKKKNETTLPTFQPQVRMEGLPLQAVQAQRPSQSRPRA